MRLALSARWIMIGVLAALAVAGPSGAAERPPVVDAVGGPTVVEPVEGGAYILPQGVRLSPNRVLVRFRPGVSPAARAAVRASVAASSLRSFKLVPRLELLRTTAADGAAEVAARLARRPDVEYALPDVLVPLAQLPDDPLYPQLWGMTNIGAPAAWDRSTGSAGIAVGVLDTGIDVTHPDLAANIWTNPGEIPANGLDDDANGFVDDVHGWDFESNDNDPSDANGHGTHVAGTIGAVGDNGVGVTGVNWTVKLVPLRICGDAGCLLSAEIAALDYAVDQGVEVVNASFGSQRDGIDAERDAIDAAGDAGVLFVAAAGNFGTDNDHLPFHPAGYDLPNVVSVAAIGATEALAEFSNVGQASVDLAAPGVDILSTAPGAGYASQGGTSMAAPHAAGAAALLWSANPGWTMAQVRARLLAATRVSSSVVGKTATCGLLDVGVATDPAFTNSSRLCVRLLGTGDGSVTSVPAGIDCGATCTASYAPNTNVTLTAAPAAGSTFAGWSGACSGTGTCAVTLAEGASVTATFRRPGVPASWTSTVLPPPPGRNPVLPKTSALGSFFTVARSADGTARAKTIFNLREASSNGFALCNYDTTDTGGVYLERKMPGGWVADGTLTSPSIGGDGYARWPNCGDFGSVVDLDADGTTLLVSQGMSQVGTGYYRCAAFVYGRGAGGGWTQEATLFPPGIGEEGSPTWEGCRYFGIGGAISDDGNRVAILSAWRADVFVRSGPEWQHEQRLELPVCGSSVSARYIALSGDGATLFLGDESCGQGRVYAFDRSGATWTLEQTIDSPESCSFPNRKAFGSSLALSQDGATVAISALDCGGPLTFPGAAWVYEDDAGNWIARRKLTAPQPEERAVFSCREVVRQGARLVCGAWERVGRNDSQGALYLVDRPHGGWAASASPFFRRAFVGEGLPLDLLGTGLTLATPADGVEVDAAISPRNIVAGLYGQDRIGYSFALPQSPTLTSFAPDNGGPGASVSLVGTNFTGVTSVAFNGVEATFTVVSPTQISTSVPAGATGGSITVTAGGGRATSSRAFLVLGPPTFADVPTSNPFFTHIERLYAEQITTGCGTNGAGQRIYCPADFVPRQQMAAFLIRAKSLPQLSPATPTFADVPTTNPFYGWIERLYQQAITTGCGTNGAGQLIYCPSEFVPRQQMAAFLIRAKGLTQLFSPTPTFADVPTSNPFYGWIERLYQQGITTGCGTNGAGQLIYCPGEFVPRQQMAAFLIRAFRS